LFEGTKPTKAMFWLPPPVATGLNQSYSYLIGMLEIVAV